MVCSETGLCLTLCGKCNTYRRDEDFGTRKVRKDGTTGRLPSYCKCCMRDYREQNRAHIADLNKAWREKNMDYVRSVQSKYYAEHRDDSIARSRSYYATNRDALLEYRRDYVRTHYDECRQQVKEWRRKNREKFRTTARKRHAHRYATDAAYNIKVRLCARLRLAVKKKSGTTAQLTGCTWSELMSHFGVTSDTTMSDVHIDHILPVNSFDMTKQEHQQLCFHYTNLQLLPASSNIQKSDHLPSMARELIENDGWTIEECALYQRQNPRVFTPDAPEYRSNESAYVKLREPGTVPTA